MHRAKYVEKIGSGIGRMKELFPNIKFEISSNWFRVILPRIETTQETTQEILKLIKEKPNITRKEIAKILNLSQDGIKYHLTNLKKQNKIKHIGSTKKGKWIILSQKRQNL